MTIKEPKNSSLPVPKTGRMYFCGLKSVLFIKTRDYP
jgi:hypothetical protein